MPDRISQGAARSLMAAFHPLQTFPLQIGSCVRRSLPLLFLLLLSCGEKQYTSSECQSLRLNVVQRCYGGNLQAGKYVGDSKCWPFSKPERMRGIWVRTFEDSIFSPGATSVTVNAPSNAVWLATDFRPDLGGDFSRAYDVDFVGRRSLCEANYGRTGADGAEVIVDRFYSIRRLPIPRT